MGTILTKGSLFPAELVSEMFNKVKGKSSLAVLSNQEPIPFNGKTEFTFSLDKEVDIVAENGKKSNGGATVEAVTIIPIKFEYGTRVSDEFMYASEEVQLGYLQAFSDGFSKKVARGLDIAAMHGFNPRTGAASDVVGNNHFDKAVTQKINYAEASADDNVDAAVSAIQGADGDVTGMAMSPTFSSALAKLKANGVRLYPDLAWGGNPGTLNGLKVDINNTVSFGTSKDLAIIGDFQNAFKWGYAKEIPIEVIPYGDPDNSGTDLKGSNQVYIRGEVYVGWGILVPSSFARIASNEQR
ncbi:phage major capsid protein [[Clostridium] symbiosum]|uniref:phage major capsid protein n=2 Tax=Clostridium symbiosum TaxID=1512 RepID=UPI00189E3B76|nr:phage major capsid protein [[Clostridium] symbiosum]